MGTAYRTDPLLRLIDVESAPSSFLNAPDAEQLWRGRVYLMTWWLSHHMTYSWFIAMANDEQHEREMKALVAQTDDGLILARLHAAAAEEAMETGVGTAEA